jgi:hypothetical protein
MLPVLGIMPLVLTSEGRTTFDCRRGHEAGFVDDEKAGTPLCDATQGPDVTRSGREAIVVAGGFDEPGCAGPPRARGTCATA